MEGGSHMTDLMIWLLTVTIAFFALRYIPMNLSLKGRMILWLSGCLISSLAVLATITYTFWIGILAALLLGFVFSVFLQSKVSHVFEGEKEDLEKTAGKGSNNSTVDEFDFWNRDNIENDDLTEDDDYQTEDESLSEETRIIESEQVHIELQEIKKEDSGQESNTVLVEEAVDLVTEEDKDGYDDENLLEELVETGDNSLGEDSHTSDEVKTTEEEDADNQYPSLLEEELTQQRINEESLFDDEDIDEQDDVTEKELMSERNLDLHFDEEDLTLEPLPTEHDKNELIESEDTTEVEQPESELELTSEIESVNSDKDIPQEMNGECSNDVDESIINKFVDPDVEDDEDSLALDVENEEELVADEALRKQLLELMIEKIEWVEEQMEEKEYEVFVKAHLSEILPDMEYYSISKYLIRFYIKHGRVDKLELFAGELIDKFSSYSLIVEELNYVIQQQVQYTK